MKKFLSLAFLFYSFNLYANPNQTMEQNNPAILIHAKANLYQIDKNFYRSEQLVKGDIEIIQNLKIASVINLRFFNRDEDEKILKNMNIALINQPLLTWHIKPKDIAQVLYTIEQQQKKGAVLIHCYHGADRTGLISGMYRIIFQNWSIADAKKEMQEGPFGYHSIWKNIDRLFTEEKVEQVKQELAKLRKSA